MSCNAVDENTAPFGVSELETGVEPELSDIESSFRCIIENESLVT